MVNYLAKHEDYIEQLLRKKPSNTDWPKIKSIHERKILYFQHERLIHLLITLFVALFTLLTFFFSLLINTLPLYLIGFILICLCLGYFFHYFQLENGVQRLYSLSDKIEEEIDSFG